MITILKKEFRSFLSLLIAYVVMIVFLLITGLMTWVFSDTSILDNGYANMDILFSIAPWIFIFLVSAITMRSFSEEKKVGTLETITTKPISDMSIILGKYFACLLLVLITLLPTLIYYYSVKQLGSPVGNIDTGAVMGSYIGLLFLAAIYVAIGIFSSSLTDNQIVAFILSMFLCFFFYAAFDMLRNLNVLKDSQFGIDWFGIGYHYNNISFGRVDTRDIVYFLSMICLFIFSTKAVFGSRKW
jgi:ABC-2 type transport system permease protein